MLERLLEYEREWFLTINGTHVEWLDKIMLFFATPYAWAPLILVSLWFLFARRGKFWYMTCYAFSALVTTTIITDMIIKPLCARYRPSTHPLFKDLVRTVNGYSADGLYGFISGHSAAAFAFATFSALAVGKGVYTAAIFLWALLMVYSRIYLGAHFITDVIPGLLTGTIVGIMTYYFYNKTT